MNEMVAVMQAAGTLAPLEIRGAIKSFREGIEASGVGEGPEMCALRHTFVNGVYAREITMLEGQTVIGRIHKHAHLNFIMQGKVRVLTELEGSSEYTAPCMFVSPMGTQRVVHILEDCVWVTVHPTKSTDPDEALEEFTTLDFADIELTCDYEVVP